jgi:tRNA-Thr(GGU) m(6)t(6)A37 methyltransferase TsaA
MISHWILVDRECCSLAVFIQRVALATEIRECYMKSNINFLPIGIIHSCFKEKFAVPRQPILAPNSHAQLILFPPYNTAESLSGLECISHLWITFIFHQSNTFTKNKVRPPRLGGNKKIGVFASRSTHRPNPIGLSVVKLDKIEKNTLFLSGIDIIDQTPVIDIKPYVPYCDIILDAKNSIAPTPPKQLKVTFSTNASVQVKKHEQRLTHSIKALIIQMLSQDPKPAYQQVDPLRIYGVNIYDINVQWVYLDTQTIEVINIVSLNAHSLQEKYSL